jgi:VanZ family protein
MKKKKFRLVLLLLAVIWFGFIFYMSSQTAADSGQMSRTITKAAILAGQKVGIVEVGTVNSEPTLEKYNLAIRKLAHVGMYFLLACVIFCALRVWGLSKKVTVILCFVISISIGIIDEINQMNFVGRNSGIISEGIKDLYRDIFGTCILLGIVVIIGVIIEARSKEF